MHLHLLLPLTLLALAAASARAVDVAALAAEGSRLTESLGDALALAGGPGRRLSAGDTQLLLAKAAQRQAVLDALLADGSPEAVAAALDVAAQLQALLSAGLGDPLDQLDAATPGGLATEEWFDGLANLHVLGGPAVDKEDQERAAAAGGGRQLHASPPQAASLVGHVHIVRAELTSRLAEGGGRRHRRGSRVRVRANNHSAPLTDVGAQTLPVATSHKLLHSLLSVEGVPLSGFVTTAGTLVFDVTHVRSTRRCRASAPGATAPGGRRRRRACVVGDRELDVDTDDEATAAVRTAWRAAVHRAVGKHGLAPAASAEAATGSAATGAGARALGVTPSRATGRRRIFFGRVRWAGQAATDGGVLSEAAARTVTGQLVQLWRDQSYGALSPAVEANQQCTYELATVNLTTSNQYVLMYNQMVAAAAAHVDPACRFTVNNANYEHVMVAHPSAPVSYAGLAYVPGFQSWYNGQYANLWVVGHEAGHNWGLLHSWIQDPLTGDNEEYGLNTEIMASARDTWGGLSYCANMKDNMGWMRPGFVLDLSPTSAQRSAELHLASIERLNGTTAAGSAGNAALPPGAVVSFRAPLMDGLPMDWLYATFRGAYNPAIVNGVELNWHSSDFDIFGDPVAERTGVMGPPTLLDVVPYSQDQADADLEAGNALVYATPYTAAHNLLIEVTGGRTRVPASSTNPADDLLPMRVSWLTEDGERPEGHGCHPDGSCQPALSSDVYAQPLLACNAPEPVLVGLSTGAQVAVFRLEAPGAVEVAATVSTCGGGGGGAPVASAVGVYTAFPFAQVLGGADVSSGAYIASSFKLVPVGASMARLSCGSVLLPLRPGQPLFLAVAAPGARWGRANVSFAPPASVAVPVTVTCDTHQPNDNRVARISGGLVELRSHDTLANGRAVYTAHNYPWLTSTTVYWDGATWRSGSTNFHTRPRIASTGVALASTAGVPDLSGIATSTYFPACPNDMWLPYNGAYPTANVCAACPANARADAGSSSPSGPSKCECDRGTRWNAGAGACELCGGNTFKTAVSPMGATSSACTACPAGKFSLPGARSSLGCSSVVCARVALRGHFDPRVNGVYARTAAVSDSLPVFVKNATGAGAPPVYTFYAPGASAWVFVEEAGAWPAAQARFAAGGDLGAAYRVAVRAPPSYWHTSQWRAVPGETYRVTSSCSCPDGTALDVATGACANVVPAVAGCPEGTALSGGTPASCVACPPFQTAATGGGCACPAGYTTHSAAAVAASGGALYAECEPPLALHVREEDAASAAVGAALPPDHVTGRCALHAVRRTAWAALAPVYRCGASAATAPESHAGTPPPPVFLVPHPDRREWSFLPDAASESHSPRYGFLGAYATGVAADIAAASGVTLPLGAAAAWRFFDARSNAFSLAVRMVVEAVPAPGASSEFHPRTSVAALVAAAASPIAAARVLQGAPVPRARTLQADGPCLAASATGSGLSGNLTGLTNAVAPFTLAGAACGSTFRAVGRYALVALELGVPLTVGSRVVVNTCSSAGGTLDTTLYVGASCPGVGSDAIAALGCVASNDDRGATCWVAAAGVTIDVTAGSPLVGATRVFALVGMYSGANSSALGVTWSAAIPSPTSSASATVSLGASASTTTSATASLSSTASPTRTRTSAATRTATVTSTQTSSATTTPTMSEGATPTSTATPTSSVTATPSSTLSVGACAALPAGTTVLSGTAGSVSGSLPATASLFTSLACTGYSLASARSQVLYSLALGANVTSALSDATASSVVGSGGVLTVNTCTGTSFDSLLFVLGGCWSSASGATPSRCSGSDDVCGDDSIVTVGLTTDPASPFYYGGAISLLVAPYGATTVSGMFSVAWSWVPPSPSPSASPSPTEASSPSATLSTGASPSASSAETATASASGAAIASGTATATATRSGAVTASRSAAATATATGSGIIVVGSPTATPTGTASAGSCERSANFTAVVYAAGNTSGVVAGNLGREGQLGRYTSVSGCAGSGGTGAGFTYSTDRQMAAYQLDLGFTAAPGGVLSVSMCDVAVAGLTQFDSVLFLTGSCPALGSPFQAAMCLASNDDSCNVASAVSITLTPATALRSYFVLVTSYSAGVTDSAAGGFAFRWSYIGPPTASATASPSSTASPSATATVTPTASLSTGASPSESPSLPPTLTSSATLTPTRSAMPTGTATPSTTRSTIPSATPSGTRSTSPSAGFCAAPRVSFTARLTGMTGSYIGNLAAEPSRFAAGACGTAVWTSARPQALFELQLPGGELELTATLVVTTCGSLGSFDTMVLVSGGACPAPYADSQCLGGNDDVCGMLSTVSVRITPATAAATYYLHVMSYDPAGFGSGAYNLTWSVTPPTDPTPSRSPTTSATATLSFGASPSLTPSATPTPSGTSTPTGSRTNTPTQTRSPSGTPSITATPPATRSSSRTPSVTPTATATPPLAVFAAGSVVVVAVGDLARPASGAPAGAALPVLLHAYDVATLTALPLQPSLVVGLPGSAAAAGAHGHACTLSHAGGNASAWSLDAEGLPATSADGVALLLPCYDVAVGASVDSWAHRTLALVDGAGRVDATTALTGVYYGSSGGGGGAPQALRSAAAQSGARAPASVAAGALVTAGHSSFGGGFRVTPAAGSWVTRPVVAPPAPGSASSADARSVGYYGGQLYGAVGGAAGTPAALAALSLPAPAAGFPFGYPTAGGAPALAALPPAAAAGAPPASPWAFVFQDATTLWVADDGAPAARSVLRYTKPPAAAGPSAPWSAAGDWLLGTDGLPVRSLAGRVEAAEPAAAFVLYAVSATTLYRAVVPPVGGGAGSSDLVVSTLTTAPAFAVFRGVAFAPSGAGMIGASRSTSASPSPSTGASAAETPTQSAATTATPSGSAAATRSATASPTRTAPSASASTPASPSGTSSQAAPSGTPVSTPSGTPTATASRVPASGSATGTPPGTPASTGAATSASASASSAATQSRSGASTGAPTGTPTASGSAAATGTGTSSRTAAATGTGTSTASRTGAPSTSRSATGTPSASGTGTDSESSSVSASPTSTSSGAPTGTPTASGSAAATGTGTSSRTAAATGTGTSTASRTGAPSTSRSATGTPSASGTGTDSESSSVSASPTSTSSGSASASYTASVSASATESRTAAATGSRTGSGTAAPTGTSTKTRVPLPSATPTRSATRTRSATATRTRTRTRTKTKSPSKKRKGLLQ